MTERLDSQSPVDKPGLPSRDPLDLARRLMAGTQNWPLVNGVIAYPEQLASVLVQLALKAKDADRMAAIVDDMIYAGHLDARSDLSDARLDYGKPFTDEAQRKALIARSAGTRIVVIDKAIEIAEQFKNWTLSDGAGDMARELLRLRDALSARSASEATVPLEDACKAMCWMCREGKRLIGFVHPFDSESFPKVWMHHLGEAIAGGDLVDDCKANSIRVLAMPKENATGHTTDRKAHP